ncbi:MAG: ABC transporter ATP-binding protein, partial [Coriobacteriia bacterium]|nr:ABC transporter ATP-binding protein [Coriobacteriia bacterium]
MQLELRNIHKSYSNGDKIEALRGIDLVFRESEFVAVLGPSGCGKTTLLNIIGGLDRYDSGELVINGVATSRFRDADWDAYRNRSIGFVFQNYNLISHQTVLENVEIALTLSGIPSTERKARAEAALASVGLADQLHKKPNQLSGGQMQRVAIARALVNDPDVILADEPTGALDSKTSLQLMELLSEIAQTRLVIMVTHNQELADAFATRVIRLLDGAVVADSGAGGAGGRASASGASEGGAAGGAGAGGRASA